MMQIQPDEAIQTIYEMLQFFWRHNQGDLATHVLLHPQLERELIAWHNQQVSNIASVHGSPIDPPKRQIFGLYIITVHNKPYPFIGIAKVITNEQPTTV